MDHSFVRRSIGAALGALLLLLVVLPGCSDDPVLGPSDGAPEEGGSYSTLNRLSPPATTVDSSQSSSKADSTTTNPARF